jgi:hypothetical protein
VNAKEILKGWLIEHGYDGLCFPEMECGCFLCDLIPCGSDPSKCVPGYKHMNEDGDWGIYEQITQPPPPA